MMDPGLCSRQTDSALHRVAERLDLVVALITIGAAVADKW